MNMGEKNSAFGMSCATHSPYEIKGKMHIFLMTHFIIRYNCDQFFYTRII